MVDLDAVEWWTFDLVREALVETVALWRRSPGAGRSPYATDGPWHLMVRDGNAGDYDARGGFDSSSDVALRPLPLNRAEVALRDRVSEWFGFIGPFPDVDDTPDQVVETNRSAALNRTLVREACGYYAAGYQQVPWRKIKHRLGVPRGEAGLRKRFERAIRTVAEALNARLDGAAVGNGGLQK